MPWWATTSEILSAPGKLGYSGEMLPTTGRPVNDMNSSMLKPYLSAMVFFMPATPLVMTSSTPSGYLRPAAMAV